MFISIEEEWNILWSVHVCLFWIRFNKPEKQMENRNCENRKNGVQRERKKLCDCGRTTTTTTTDVLLSTKFSYANKLEREFCICMCERKRKGAQENGERIQMKYCHNVHLLCFDGFVEFLTFYRYGSETSSTI